MAKRDTTIRISLRDGVTRGLRRIGGGFRSLTRSIGLATGALVGIGVGLSRLARASAAQEDAENRLTTAIQNGAGATAEEIEQLQRLAAERQKVTRFGDEQTISAQAQLATFQLNAAQIAELIPRVQDLAEASRRLGGENVDLEQSAILVGKALNGNAGELSRYGVVLNDAQREALRFGDQNERIAALTEALDGNFRGLAESLTPYSQGVISAQNAFGDLIEQLGSFITSSPGVNNAITTARETIERWTAALANNGGQVERFVQGSLAAFRVLGDTVQVIFNGILVGVNKFETVTLAGVRNIAAGLARITFGDTSDALDAFVDRADARLEELEQSGQRRFDNLGEATAGFVENGRQLNDIIFQGTEAQQAANAASAEAQRLASEQSAAEKEKAKAVERTSAALKKLGVDAELIDTGISENASDAQAALLQLAADGEASLAVIAAAAAKAAGSFSQTEIDAFNQQLQRAADEGRITAEAMTALQQGIGNARTEADGTAGTFERLQGAITQASDQQNLSGLAALRSELETLRNGGELTGAQFDQLEQQIVDASAGIQQAVASSGNSAGDASQSLELVTESAGQAEAGLAGFANQLAGALNQAASLSDGAAIRTQELVDRFNRLNVAGTEIIRGFRAIGDITRTVNAEFAEQNAQVDALLVKYRESGNSLTFANDAQRLLNQNLVISADRQQALTSIIEAGTAARDRERESIERNIASLRDEIAILNGADAERIRFDRRRAELQERIENSRGETQRLLREELRLLERAQKLERGKADEATRAADATERKTQAEERARQAGGFGPQRIEVELKASGGTAGSGGLTESQVEELAAQLLPAIIAGIEQNERQQR